MTEYWKGCGPSCCRCHCDCDYVVKWRADAEAAVAAITPERLAAIKAEAKIRFDELSKFWLADDDPI